MVRRSMIAVAGLSLALGSGCGSMMLAAQEGEPVWLLHRVSRNVYEPSHRVVVAALEVLKVELKEVEIVADELSRDSRFDTPDGKTPKPGEAKIPDDYPAFWIEGLDEKSPVIANCRFCAIQGKAPDGRKVDVVIRIDFRKPEQYTVVSAQIGRWGNETSANKLLDKIAERASHPTHPPGSPEERADLGVLFGPRPDTDDKKVLAAGDLRIRKK